jgi:hypothetical protein
MDADTAQPGTRSKHASRDEPPPNNDHDDQTDIEDMGSVDPYADTERAVDPRNEGWDIETHLRYPEKGSKLGLNRQKPAIYRVLRGGIANSLVALCFENAFPNVDDRIRMIRDALYKSAKGYNLGKIAHRLTMDSDYVEDMASLVSFTFTQVAIWRSDLQKNIFRYICVWGSSDIASKVRLQHQSLHITVWV